MAGVLKRKKKTKRGGRKNKKQDLTIFSTNAAGLKSKMQSLKNEIKNVNASIFTVQETHFPKKGKMKMENFTIFESIRKKTKWRDHDWSSQFTQTHVNIVMNLS